MTSGIENLHNLKLSICLSCGARCCKYHPPILTVFDIARICKFLNVEVEDFISNYCEVINLVDLASQDITLKSITQLFTSYIERLWSRNILKYLTNFKVIRLRKVENSCIFLKNNLCSINPVKPMICRVFPIKPFRTVLTGYVVFEDKCPLSRYSELLVNELNYLIIYLMEMKTHIVITLGLRIDEIVNQVKYLLSSNFQVTTHSQYQYLQVHSL